MRDKDGIGAALVFADLAAWAQDAGRPVLGYLEEIQREFGLYVADQRNFTFKGPEGAETIPRPSWRASATEPPKDVGGRRVVVSRDYRRRASIADGRDRAADATEPPTSSPTSSRAARGSRCVLAAPEPKIKYYFELKETLERNEPLPRARARAEERLRELMEAFSALAKVRGQP